MSSQSISYPIGASSGSSPEPLLLPPAFDPGTSNAPLLLPPAFEEGTREAPLFLPPAPPPLPPMQRLRQDTVGMWLLVASPIVLLALLLWLVPSYNTLPELMPLHFDAQGNADRIGERSEIWVLPAIGGIVYLTNLLSGLLLRFRLSMDFASYLLWGGALIVQVIIWLTVWNITH